jgi:hypothetical protein
VEACTFVDNARIELDGDRSANDLTQKATRVSGVASSVWHWAVAVGGHGGWPEDPSVGARGGSAAAIWVAHVEK